jgi:hypothetical protein
MNTDIRYPIEWSEYIMSKPIPANIKNNPITADPVMTPDENAKMIKLCIETFNAPAPDINNPEEVRAAIDGYFASCIEKELRPGNLGLYARLDLSKQDAHDIVIGKKKINPASADLLKKAIKALSTFREMLGSQGKINPATLIFWGKNFDGLSDVQQIEISPRDTPAAEQTPEQIAAALEADVIQDN